MSVREKQSIIGTLNADKKQSIVGNIGIADVLIREGEYYVPNVSQVDEDTIVLSLTPSKDFMETVSDQEITLPRGRTGEPGRDGKDGKDGSDYVLTNEDKSEIADQAVSLIDIPDVSGMVTSINGVKADENGNVEIVAGVQSDWNQNDETATDYVKNRTHWEEHNLTTIINKRTVTVNSSYAAISSSCPILTPGQTYIVVLNDVTYQCVARTYGAAVLLGNGRIYGDGMSSNNEPFAIDIYSSGTAYLNVASSGKYTVSLLSNNTTVHTIDPKYLPESVKQVYTLPVATDAELGGVKSGGDVLIDEDGVMRLAEGLITDVIRAPSTAIPGQVLSVKSVDETGKPIDWETVDTSSGGGGVASVQPDWNQNDPDAPDYVKNRPITRIESLDTTSLVNLRDLESGQYILYGYFSPYVNSDISITADNSMVSVIRKNAGSHIICLDPLNAKIVFFEILVDETTEKGYQYTRTIIPILEVNELITKVGNLEGLTTADKTDIVTAINEIVMNMPTDDHIRDIVAQGNTVEVDTTLSKEGKAADAKAVGESLNRKIPMPVDEAGEVMTGEPNQVLTINQDGAGSWEYQLIIDATKTEGYQHVVNKNGKHQELLCIDIAKPVLGIYRMSNYQDSVVYPYVRIVNGDTVLVSSMSLGAAAVYYIDVFEVNDKYVQFRDFASNGHCSSYLYDIAENSWTVRKLLNAASYVDFNLSQKITTPNTASVGQVLAVKAVDENGKPTEWETIDASSGVDEELTAAIDDLIELGFIEPVVENDNSLFIDENENIYIY